MLTREREREREWCGKQREATAGDWDLRISDRVKSPVGTDI